MPTLSSRLLLVTDRHQTNGRLLVPLLQRVLSVAGSTIQLRERDLSARELMNTAIAGAQDPIAMAEAMKYAVYAGRLAYKAGRIPRKLYATASSPIEGML